MKGFLLGAAMVLVWTGMLAAQEPEITPEMPVSEAALVEWLHSSDPRLVAWAADFARRRKDMALIAQMPGLFAHWSLPPDYGGDQAQAAQRRAALAVLDALIQDNAEVPVQTVQAIAGTFPAQAAILAARMPLASSRGTLEGWTLGRTGRWGAVLARVATMLLAKDPGASQVHRNGMLIGLVADVVDESEQELRITVRRRPDTDSGVGSGSCGDSLSSGLTPGWPEVYWYGLNEAVDDAPRGPVVVQLNGDAIYSERHEESRGWGSCGGVEPLNARTRHRLLAYWLKTPEKAMAWQPEEEATIVWTDEARYEAELGRLVEEHRRTLAGTAVALRARGLLRADEKAMPRLVVTVTCAMDPCSLR